MIQVRNARILSLTVLAIGAVLMTTSTLSPASPQDDAKAVAEVMGLAFLLLALAGAQAAVREYQRYASRGHIAPGRFLLALGFSLLFAWFSASAFWRARRAVRKS